MLSELMKIPVQIIQKGNPWDSKSTPHNKNELLTHQALATLTRNSAFYRPSASGF